MKRLKKILAVLIAVVLAVAVLAAAFLIVSRLYRSDPADLRRYETSNPYISAVTQIAAHRSGAGIAPEQTLEALRYCVENEDFSVDFFEFDLHITADDVLVLLHDHTLDRTSDSEAVFGAQELRPEEKTYEELLRLNMGAKFTAPDGSMPYAGLSEVPDSLRILRLEDALDYLQAAGQYRYIIEIKNSGQLGQKSADALYAVLRQYNILDKVIVGTFHSEVAAYLDEAYPDLTRSTHMAEVVEFLLAALTGSEDYVPPCEVLQIPFCSLEDSYGLNLGVVGIINYAHAHDMAVQYWTINDAEDMAYLASIGADAIMTDYPDVLHALLEQ